MTDPFWSLVQLVAMFSVTFFPAGLALARQHHNRIAIGLTNVIGALILLGSCTAVAIGSIGPGHKAEAKDVGAGVLIGLLLGSPFWIVSLIWAATAVKRSPPSPAAPRPRAPRPPDDDEPPVYEVPEVKPRRKR